MPVWKPYVAVKPVAKAVAAPAAAAVIGSGQASTATQVLKQTVTQTNNQSVGPITGDGNRINSPALPTAVAPPDGSTISQTNTNVAVNANVPVNIQVKNVAVAAGDNSTATVE
jgi:hypothetical protein